MFWTHLGPLKVLFCWKSLTRLGLILDSCFNRWKRPPRQTSSTAWTSFGPLKLPSCRRVLLPSWTVESARPLTESPTPTRLLLLLNRTVGSVRLVKESDLFTASVPLKASYVLDRWNLPVLPKCPARLELVLNRLDPFDLFRLRQLKVSVLPKRLDC